MKKLLIGILALGSFSSFAADYVVNNVPNIAGEYSESFAHNPDKPLDNEKASPAIKTVMGKCRKNHDEAKEKIISVYKAEILSDAGCRPMHTRWTQDKAIVSTGFEIEFKP